MIFQRKILLCLRGFKERVGGAELAKDYILELKTSVDEDNKYEIRTKGSPSQETTSINVGNRSRGIVISVSRDGFKVHRQSLRSWRPSPVLGKKLRPKDHCDIDAAIVTDHMAFEPAPIWVWLCWVCAFNPDLCHDYTGSAGRIWKSSYLPIGYPESKASKEKRPKVLLALPVRNRG